MPNLAQETLQLVFDNMQTALYVTDVETYEIIFANKALRSAYPYEIEGRKCWEVLSTYGKSCPYCKQEEMVKKPLGEALIWENYNSDMGCWLQMNDSVIRWHDGRLAHMINVTDITGIKRNEAQLSEYKDNLEKLLTEKTESQEMLLALNDNIAEGFIYQLEEAPGMIHAQMRYMSAGLEKVCGLNREEVMRNVESLFPHFNQDDLLYIIECRAAHRTYTRDVRFNRPDGVEIWLKISERPRTKSDGTVAWDGIAVDITHRKRMELDLVHSQEELQRFATRLRDVSNNMINTALYRSYLDDQGHVTIDYASEQWEKIVGVSIEDTKKDLTMVLRNLHPEDRAGFMSAISKSTGEMGDAVSESRYIHPSDGRTIWLRLQSRGFVQNGRILRDGMLSDITQQKTLENELIAARDQAQKSDLLKSTFLANMSHEIRTPMNAIVGFLNLLGGDEEIPRDTQKEYIRIVQDSADQLLTLIGDILDISKIDAGQMKIIPEPLQVNALLTDMLSSYRTNEKIMAGKDIELIMEAPASEELVVRTIDPNRLRQVLGNLVGNAIKFTDKGHVKFGYKAAGDKLAFFVEDTGIGIDAKEMGNLGKPFHQVHDTRHAAKYGGTGIGLAISMNLVKLMGGDFSVKSEAGKGSLFEFTIPSGSTEPETPVKQEETPASTGALKSPDFSGATLLIAEDTYTNFFYLKTLLRHSNATIIHAWNGQEAIDAVKEHPEIDLVLMDVKMPVMDGIEAVKHVKALRPDLPVIVQTAYAMHDDRHRMIEAGFGDYIAKPINRDELFEMIAKYLKK